jgi:hypothetical protein
MQEENFSETESLKLIGEMISKVKRSYVTKGIASIVWGVLIMVCSLLTWAEIQYHWNPGFDVWLLVFLALIPQIFFSIKEKNTRKFKAHDETTTVYVWTAFAISIFILSFYNSRFGSNEATTLFMMLYGIPTFITGGMFNFKPMIAGGLVCWTLSVISIFTPVRVDMLLMAACGLFAWLIPGIILWNRYKRNQHCENV